MESKNKSKYRDGLFRDYFCDKTRLMSLCNALLKTNCKNPNEVEINTLDGIFFSQVKNDISCLFQNRFIVLIEHQSTRNENMPLRVLFYVTELLRQSLDKSKQKLYKEQLIKLPKPEFYVLYNGSKAEEESRILKLSSTFDGDDSFLELKVKLYNINEGNNKELLNQCKYLNNYCIFVNRVKHNLTLGMDIKQSIRETIKHCLEGNIMADYLKTKQKEVFEMIDFEFDINEAKAVWREEAIEEGRAQGRAQGIAQGRAQGRAEGIAEGRTRGIAEGRKEGRETGIREGEDKLSKLINMLVKKGLNEDILKVTTDREFRKQLYAQYGI